MCVCVLFFFVFFFISFVQNIECVYALEPPHLGGLKITSRVMYQPIFVASDQTQRLHRTVFILNSAEHAIYPDHIC